MLCTTAEERLSEYMEAILTAEEMAEMAGHLKGCPGCSALLAQMRTSAEICSAFPEQELSPRLVETILLRTSGRPRTRSLREILSENLLRPLWTPRFAVGAAVAVLFVMVSAQLIIPRMSGVLSALSPSHILTMMDRGVQQVYGQGLRAYNTKTQWENELSFFKKSILDRFRYVMEQIDAPVEGSKKPEDPQPPKRKGVSNTGLRNLSA